MDEAQGENLDKESALRHKKLCADFDKFEYKHLELENAYNRAKQAAEDALENIEDVLFRIKKNSYDKIRGDIEEIGASAVRAVNPYVVSGNAEELKEISEKIGREIRRSAAEKISDFFGNLFGKAVKNRDSSDYAAVKTFLERMREKHGIMLAGSFGELAGKVIRIGHMGASANVGDMLEVMSGLEETLRYLGWKSENSLLGVFHTEL